MEEQATRLPNQILLAERIAWVISSFGLTIAVSPIFINFSNELLQNSSLQPLLPRLVTNSHMFGVVVHIAGLGLLIFGTILISYLRFRVRR